jgi:hypothetical protein
MLPRLKIGVSKDIFSGVLLCHVETIKGGERTIIVVFEAVEGTRQIPEISFFEKGTKVKPTTPVSKFIVCCSHKTPNTPLTPYH